MTTVSFLDKIRTMAKNNDSVFKEGQNVVYPLQGVGRIEKIQERVFKGENTPYYQIYLEDSDMTIMVPIAKAKELGIRPIISNAVAKKALKTLSEEPSEVVTDWKLRYQMNLDLIKSGEVCNIAIVVRTLYTRSKAKELPILERKLYDNALTLLKDELSIAFSKTKDEIEQDIFASLEK